MACGVPSIGFRVGGIPEMIDHQQNGYVANYRDTEEEDGTAGDGKFLPAQNIHQFRFVERPCIAVSYTHLIRVDSG